MHTQIINSFLQELETILSPLGLSIKYNPKYDFSDYPNAVAIYQYRSVIKGPIRVALNMPALTEACETWGTDIKEQIKISLAHECGHGLIQWLKHLRRIDTQKGTKLFTSQMRRELKEISQNEEVYAEEFGEFYTFHEKSDLEEFIEKNKQALTRISKQV